MAASRPYATKMRNVISHLVNANVEYKHPYLVDRDVKRVGYIVISSDRGLCGGLNINVFKQAVGSMKEWSDKDVEIDVCTVGRKAASFFKRVNCSLVAETSGLGDKPHLEDLIGAVKVMLNAFDEGRIDRLYLVQNEFVNTMTQRPEVMQLLPAKPADDEQLKHHWDYIYEPDAKDVLDGLLVRYIESQVYQGVVENVACEMSARMVAMKSATDNAGELINELQRVYNKARQAAITQEISEIVAGAAAV
jgi:F-type H+-transporting ATPase subunit gamma